MAEIDTLCATSGDIHTSFELWDNLILWPAMRKSLIGLLHTVTTRRNTSTMVTHNKAEASTLNLYKCLINEGPVGACELEERAGSNQNQYSTFVLVAMTVEPILEAFYDDTGGIHLVSLMSIGFL